MIESKKADRDLSCLVVPRTGQLISTDRGLVALRGQAARTVAQHSADADDCRGLLSMLGLDEPPPAVPPAD